MAQKIKVIIKRPDEEYGHVTAISNTLKNLQNTVGGYIEVINMPGYMLIVNEEGTLQDMPYNCHVHGFTLFGTIIVAGIEGDEFSDVGISFADWRDIIDESNGGAR